MEQGRNLQLQGDNQSSPASLGHACQAVGGAESRGISLEAAASKWDEQRLWRKAMGLQPPQAVAAS